MNIKQIALVVGICLVVSLVVAVYVVSRTSQAPLGAGELFNTRPSFVQGFTAGIGRLLSVSNNGSMTFSGLADLNVSSIRNGTSRQGATSSAGTVLTAADVCSGGRILANNEGGQYASTTVPTAASLIALCMPNIGDTRTIFVVNSSSATTSPLVAGGTYATGTTMFNASSTKAIAGEVAEITFYTISTSTVSAYQMLFR